MNKLYRSLGIVALIALFISACGARAAQAQPEEQDAPRVALYEEVLGGSLADQAVLDFIAINNCSHVGQLQVCKDVGMDLWIDFDQTVKTIHLYLNNGDGYTAYKGALPFGLKFYDLQGAVEYKLKRRGVGNAGLPDEGSSPDHFHYWAVYKQHNMIIIYNSPFPDEDATIYAILVSK
jgi:hypothetical protein